jgi:radical SAM protein with 4Fe4S-binding SPASM domain
MKDNEGQWEDFQKLLGPIVDAVAYVDYIDHGSQNNPERTIVPIKPKEGRFCCPQLWQRMFIHPDGIVTVCCMDSLRTLQIGNIFEQSVKEIWLSGKYQELRELHASGRRNEIPMCARCPLTRAYKT